MEERASSTKNLKRVLGFGDLMGVAFGYIIGAGIMTLLGSAIAMTGRSVPFAFLLAAVITICQFLPTIITAGTVRLRGGSYTMVAMLCGKQLAGTQVIIFLFQSMSMAMYTLSFGSYFCSLFGLPAVYERFIGFGVLTLLYAVNLMGVDKFAKTQRVISATLILALGLFAGFGMGKIQPGYFASEGFFTGGVFGFLQAAGMLTFALGGGSGVVSLSAEAKNPTRDIPLVAIISTVVVAVIYALVGFVGAGVLPVEEVAGQNLTVVASVVMPKFAYVFFVACGAGLALVSPINGQLATGPRPVMQMCDDGWLPRKLATLNKNGSPWVIQTWLYVMGALATFANLSVSTLVSLSIVAGGFISVCMNLCVMRLPVVCPEEWAASKFKLPKPLLVLACLIGGGASAFNVFINARNLTPALLGLNVVVVIGALCLGVLRGRRVEMEISYEKA